MTTPRPANPARVALEAALDRAENQRAEASLALTDAEDAYREANEEVIHLETALAELGRLEGPLFAPAPPSPAKLADQVVDELARREARR